MKRIWMFHLVGKPMRRNIFKGAVFADLYKDFSEDRIRIILHSSISREIYQHISELGVGEGTYVRGL